MLWALQTFGDWLRAIPGPTEHWATILAAWAWPTAILIIAYWLRRPLTDAAHRLAKRFESDNIEVGSWLKVTADTQLKTLDQQSVTEAPDTPEAKDARLIEALLEYAGESEANVDRLLDWIEAHGGTTLSVEAFLTEDRFAEQRKMAYKELIEGQANG